MRDLLFRLNTQNIKLDISTFSKASKVRKTEVFTEILNSLVRQLQKQKNAQNELALFPIDSTIICLTSKLLWSQGYHQVKLFSGLNSLTGEIDGILINFGFGPDHKYGDQSIAAIPKNGIGIMDRGFASLAKLKDLSQQNSEQKIFFLLRIGNNYSLNMLENGLFKVGTGADSGIYRVVNFGDRETRKEYRLVTNLPSEGEGAYTNEEVGEVYRQRWGIELLWKFLKMHLKLDKLSTKNPNGIEIQIYATLIAYLLIKLVSIPPEFGDKLLDKLRYLQAFMCQQISYRTYVWGPRNRVF